MHHSKRSVYRAILIGLAGLGASNVFSGSMGDVSGGMTHVATLSAGPVWHSGGTTQTFFLDPEIEKSFVSDNSTHALADVEVFMGYQRMLNAAFQGQLGVAVGVTGNAKFSGVVWDDTDPQFDNYTYNYSVQHTHVALKGKLLTSMGWFVTPWLSGSVGVAFNNAHGFNNSPTIFEAIETPNFLSHTTTDITYTVGAGIQRDLTSHWQVGAGYEFADWGKSSLSHSPGQTMNSGLAESHLYTNGVLLNITYIG